MVNYRKHFVDQNYFSIPDVENSYIAGFLAADGNISNIKYRVKLKIADLECLEFIKNRTKYSGPILFKDYMVSSGDIHRIYILKIDCKKWVKDLYENFKITPKKTRTIKPPVDLNLLYQLIFLIGCIDGDGSICINNFGKGRYRYNTITIGITGNIFMLTWIKNMFDMIVPSGLTACGKQKPLAGVHKQRFCVGSTTDYTYGYNVSGKRAINIIKFLLCIPAPFRLQRKWGVLKNFLENYLLPSNVWTKEEDFILMCCRSRGITANQIYLSNLVPNRSKNAIGARLSKICKIKSKVLEEIYE